MNFEGPENAEQWRAWLGAGEKNWYERIDFLANRAFHHEQLSLQAANYVLEKLSENNCRRMTAWNHKSKPNTYLTTVVTNLIKDYRNSVYGKVKAPEWVKDIGEPWLSLWFKVCVLGDSVASAIEEFRYGLSKADVVKFAQELKEKIKGCGDHTRKLLARLDPMSEAPTEKESLFQPGAAALTGHSSEENKLKAIMSVLLGESLDEPEISALTVSFRNAMRRDPLDELERRVLRAHFVDFECRIAPLARAFDLTDYKARQMLEASMVKIQAAFDACGIATDG